MRNKDILISGASVAGPALAFWLRRHGFNPTVVERAPAPRPGGQGIDLRGAGRDVAERMGLLPAIRDRHTGVHGISFLDRAGRPVATMGADDLGDSGGIIADIEILRGDLVDILYGATANDVEYLFGDSITALTEHADGVHVTFADAAPRRFDLVIGADGLYSNVRALKFGPHTDFLRDLGHHAAVFAAPLDVDLGGTELAYNLPGDRHGGRMAMLYPNRHGAHRGMFFFASPPLAYDRSDPAAQRELVADRFADDDWYLPQLVEAMRAADDFYFYRPSLVNLPTWSSGRVALLGDAVFAGSVGMGTSMAMVGAYVLAGELAAAHGDHRTAFAAYQRELTEFVAVNRKPLPGGLKGFLPPTWRRIWLRNQLMRAIMASPLRNAMTGDLQKTANAVQLKDYAPLRPAHT